MHIRKLIQLLDSILDPSSYRDYAPNGLQVQGRRDVKRLVTGVTASFDLIEAAAAQDADALLVHHGWFWKGGRSAHYRSSLSAYCAPTGKRHALDRLPPAA